MLRQQGFTLIEVLVASLVIILGLMSVVNMQLASQKKAFNIHHTTLAGLYTQDLQARLNINTCYLSKVNLEEFIEGYPTRGSLYNFLEEQTSKWRGEHFVNSRSGWNSSLTAGIGTFSSLKEAIEKSGYWKFHLTINLSKVEKDQIKQTLLVEYKKNGCN